MYLLDTNICIYIIKQKPAKVLETLKNKRSQKIFISSITIAELECCISKSRYLEKNRFALVEFLSLFEILPFEDIDAISFGSIKTALEKKGKIIGPLNLLLASQAVARDLVFVTDNTKEFNRVPDIKIENWVE